MPCPPVPLHLTPTCRYLWMAACQAPWNPACHGRFPPAFQAAAQALMMSAHRLGSCAAGRSEEGAATGPSTLGCLPDHILLEVVRLAAYPLSAWVL
jgi:hypothetical protein